MRETEIDPVVRNRFHSLHRLIGNTPLLVVDVLFLADRAASSPSTSR